LLDSSALSLECHFQLPALKDTTAHTVYTLHLSVLLVLTTPLSTLRVFLIVSLVLLASTVKLDLNLSPVTVMQDTFALEDLESRHLKVNSTRRTILHLSLDHVPSATSADVDLVSLRSVLLVLSKIRPVRANAKTALLEPIVEALE